MTWWYKHEIQAHGRLEEEESCKFEVSLGCVARLSQNTKRRTKEETGLLKVGEGNLT